MNAFVGYDVGQLFKKHYEYIESENDRGAVLVVASLLDSGLENALKAKLVKTEEIKDSLFAGGNAPLGTFSAKIDIAFRLGIINFKTKETLNLFRKMRNEFAHNFETSDLESSRIKDRLMAIFKKHPEYYENLVYSFKKSANLQSDSEFEAFFKNEWPVRTTFNFYFAVLSVIIWRTHIRYDHIPEYEEL